MDTYCDVPIVEYVDEALFDNRGDITYIRMSPKTYRDFVKGLYDLYDMRPHLFVKDIPYKGIPIVVAFSRYREEYVEFHREAYQVPA